MTSIAVTGAAGFIGSIVISVLNSAGYKDIVAVDSLGTDGRFKNLRTKSYKEIVSPSTFLSKIASGACRPDAIIHMGAITDTSETNGDRLLEHNTHYSHSLATYCVEHNARYIYASSASVYGDGVLGFSDDSNLTPTLLPLNAYAFSKWLFDMAVLENGWNAKMVGLRFFNVFGPNEYHKGRMASVVWHAYNQIHDTGTVTLFASHNPQYGNGGQLRDFIYVRDVADTILWFLEHPDSNGIFNLGTGTARSFKDLATSVFTALGREPRIEFVPTPENIRGSYQYFTEATLNNLRAAGYRAPFASLEDSAKEYVTQYLAKSNPYW